MGVPRDHDVPAGEGDWIAVEEVAVGHGRITAEDFPHCELGRWGKEEVPEGPDAVTVSPDTHVGKRRAAESGGESRTRRHQIACDEQKGGACLHALRDYELQSLGI